MIDMHVDALPMGFGKYKTKSPIQVHDTDPKYLVWAYETIGKHICTEALYISAKLEIDEDYDYEEGKDEDITFGFDTY